MLSEEPVQFIKNILQFELYREYTLPINLYDGKYWTRERGTYFIRSELKWNTNEYTACMFLTWTSLKLEMEGKGTMRCWWDNPLHSVRFNRYSHAKATRY